MIIAIEGCAHGELDQIYRSVENLSRQRNVKVDLLICCGDFQAVRNENDLQCMAVPDKFRHICTFYKYYSGEVKAPILTLFIGGNHEASNYLQELAYGGWVAPNIYYLGYAGVVKFGGIRIAGISGIFKGHDYLKGHFEKPPYTSGTMRSAYHVRSLEVFRLKQLKESIDIFISHDWPRGIYNYADTRELLHWKPFFRDEIANNVLGSQAGEILLHELKPKYWFSAHLHCRFAATVQHNETQSTNFLALDKCLPRRQYLELIEVPHDTNQGFELSYDPQWLAILRSTNHLLSVRATNQYLPSGGPGSTERWEFYPSKEEIEEIKTIFNDDYKIPSNFVQTAEPFKPRPNYNRNARQAEAQLNPQTTEFCEKLGIGDPLEMLIGKPIILSAPVVNPDEIALEDDDEEEQLVDQSEEPACHESNDVFFVDTKPQKRSKMILPQPQIDTPHDEPLPKEKEQETETINLNKPSSMMVNLWNAVNELEDWKSGKGIILHSIGETFCSGGDLNTVRQISNPDEGYKMSTLMHNTLTRLHQLPLISVALIQGKALGGGAELATACDFRLFTENGEIGFVQGRMGVVTGWGGGTRLVQLLGQHRALELLLTSRQIAAPEAVALGLANGITTSSELTEAVEEAKQWLQPKLCHAPQIVHALKHIVATARSVPYEESLLNERQVFAMLWGGVANKKALEQNIKHK
uniref:EOG090X06RW n=1 Tax=Daphnia lumholtzi TaxID=42856 RepID=A0A4Y7MA00_9CRUS|nr:EOG090X06RW [Daphnia lumholtzi]